MVGGLATAHPTARIFERLRDSAASSLEGVEPVLIGYMRVSKADGSQVVDLQRDALVAAGVAAEQLYTDRASGKRDDRPGLEACLKALRADDTLVIWKLDRLGRNLKHLVNVVQARIASLEWFLTVEVLPHLICFPSVFRGGSSDEAGEHGNAR